jgi:membrane protease subunit (stomatin/prohibitin family)
MQFVMVAGEMSTIVQDSEKEMIQVIQGENLDVEKFNEIMEARQSPETDKINASAEEITAFNNAAMKVIEIQNAMREEMQKVITRQGMDAAKFQEMMMAYQQDPAFQQKVNQLLGE